MSLTDDILPKIDPDQIDNFFDHSEEARERRSTYTLAGRPFSKIVHRLDALLLVLKTCKAASCRDPWGVLHPDGKIKDLRGALAETFDAFYEKQPRVKFEKCLLGYLEENEKPLSPILSSDEVEGGRLRDQGFEYKGHWSLYT